MFVGSLQPTAHTITAMAALIVKSNRSVPGSSPDFKDEIQHATVEDLKRTATLVVADEISDSGVFDAAVEEKIPRFEMKEIRLGRTLGRGGFCTVTEIEKIKIIFVYFSGPPFWPWCISF